MISHQSVKTRRVWLGLALALPEPALDQLYLSTCVSEEWLRRLQRAGAKVRLYDVSAHHMEERHLTV